MATDGGTTFRNRPKGEPQTLILIGQSGVGKMKTSERGGHGALLVCSSAYCDQELLTKQGTRGARSSCSHYAAPKIWGKKNSKCLWEIQKKRKETFPIPWTSKGKKRPKPEGHISGRFSFPATEGGPEEESILLGSGPGGGPPNELPSKEPEHDKIGEGEKAVRKPA